ncbi:carnitine O-acetyltransferase-like [Mya arenaria]|uniref:carnitine O-acetyltransferase-like n=1 Tax=Mya arenaria TaxID=6604 RepID=UPI0022E517BB|nr:carnitine O-acetyltransferase-like [Mya arenaria]
MYSAISRIMARQIAPLTASPALKMSAVKPRRITGRMFSVQASLPRFPVAPLQQTLDKYLQTLRPLVSDHDFRHAQKLCEDFKTGVGPLLQTKLEERAQKHTNWLSDWWRQVAYLDVRESCVINSNPGVLFPKADFNDLQGQLSYAARLIAGVLDYKVMIDTQTLPVEHLGKAPLCMMQYYQILSACRIPGVNTDDWVCFPPDQPNPPRHITIVYNNNFFEVPVYDSENKPLNSTQLRAQLEAVVSQGSSQGPPLGLFTMENRENWARAYKNMCKDEVTKSSLESIQRSIVVICLDQPNPSTPDPRTTSGHQMLHGAGSQLHTGNRWFDKTIQFVVGQDGVSGLNYEHTSAEGPPVIHLMDHCLEYINSGKDWEAAGTAATPRLLTMNLSHDVENSLNLAKENIDRMVQDLDLKVFTFEEFGKNFPKSQRVSPDSFIQSAIQLAYYRHHRKPVGSYESGSIRMFQLGRTETIRSCSSSSLEFTQAMLDPSQSNQKRAELLRRAINSHKQYTNDAISGKGIDRHFLGLSLIAQENKIELPELFKDPNFVFSKTWRISTSQVPAKSESVLFFGPVCPDGYGFCYNPQEKRILFGISSFKSNDVTLPAAQMCELVADSLRDMRQVMESSVKSSL